MCGLCVGVGADVGAVGVCGCVPFPTEEELRDAEDSYQKMIATASQKKVRVMREWEGEVSALAFLKSLRSPPWTLREREILFRGLRLSL